MKGFNVILGLRPLVDEGVEDILILLASGSGGEAFVVSPFGAADCAAERFPFLVVTDGDNEPVVVAFTSIAALRGGDRAAIAARPGDASRHLVFHQVRAHERYRCLLL